MKTLTIKHIVAAALGVAFITFAVISLVHSTNAGLIDWKH